MQHCLITNTTAVENCFDLKPAQNTTVPQVNSNA